MEEERPRADMTVYMGIVMAKTDGMKLFKRRFNNQVTRRIWSRGWTFCIGEGL